mmetsp:Transcript_29321/g.91124  ORF Transcript_29321/g.91124 Transcript_29321/m.91124 type:complete len:226 (+) Transcript_29321:123-800(+)
MRAMMALVADTPLQSEPPRPVRTTSGVKGRKKNRNTGRRAAAPTARGALPPRAAASRRPPEPRQHRCLAARRVQPAARALRPQLRRGHLLQRPDRRRALARRGRREGPQHLQRQVRPRRCEALPRLRGLRQGEAVPGGQEGRTILFELRQTQLVREHKALHHVLLCKRGSQRRCAGDNEVRDLVPVCQLQQVAHQVRVIEAALLAVQVQQEGPRGRLIGVRQLHR